MRSINFFSLLLIISAIVFLPVTTKAQVTIGSTATPQEFSILELIVPDPESRPLGFRLPQLDIFQRYAISDAHGSKPEMMGLQVFDTFTHCVHTWDGSVWIANCYGGAEPPGLPVSVFPASRCGITPTSGSSATFTAIADPNAVMYRFIINAGAANARIITQTSNVLVLSEPVAASAVTVEYLFPESFVRPSFAERMVRVEGGSFAFGSGTQESVNPTASATTATGTLTTISTFYVARTPVTQAQFEAVMGFNPSSFQCHRSGVLTDVSGTAFVPSSSRPVERVTWFDAIAFANRLSVLEDRDIFYHVDGMSREDWYNITFETVETTWVVSLPSDPRTNNGFRLLTEAEWEFAARGGTLSNANTGGGANSDYYFSNGNDGANVWHSQNPATGGRTHPVGQFNSNALGLYDMSGNVWDWVWNWWSNPAGASDGDVDPVGPAVGSNRVLRGGGWDGNVAGSLVSHRNNFTPTSRFGGIGFRLASSSVE